MRILFTLTFLSSPWHMQRAMGSKSLHPDDLCALCFRAES